MLKSSFWFLVHTQLCSGGPVCIQGSLVAEPGGPKVVLGIQAGLPVSKISILSNSGLFWPLCWQFSFIFVCLFWARPVSAQGLPPRTQRSNPGLRHAALSEVSSRHRCQWEFSIAQRALCYGHLVSYPHGLLQRSSEWLRALDDKFLKKLRSKY